MKYPKLPDHTYETLLDVRHRLPGFGADDQIELDAIVELSDFARYQPAIHHGPNMQPEGGGYHENVRVYVIINGHRAEIVSGEDYDNLLEAAHLDAREAALDGYAEDDWREER